MASRSSDARIGSRRPGPGAVRAASWLLAAAAAVIAPHAGGLAAPTAHLDILAPWQAVAVAAAPQAVSRDSRQRAAERIRALQREAEALATQESTLLVQLRRFEVERQLRTEELLTIERDRAVAEQALAATAAKAAALQRTADTERPEIESRLVRVYKLGQEGFWRLLLDVDDLRSAGRAYRTASALTRIDRDRVLEHQRTLEALTREQTDLRRRLAEIVTLQAKARTARAAADRAVADRTTLVASIDARRDLNAQLTGELQSAQQRLQASVDQLTPGGTPVVLPIKAFRGALPWPARGRILARFGQSSGTRNGTATTWSGIEVAVLEGQTVRAVHEGTVAYADLFSGYGNLVIIEHGDKTHSLYGYLSSLTVSKGDRVDAQAPIGASGLDPSGVAALYFELRIDGKAVDPLQWLLRE